jgi:hypothetical protein
VIEVLEIALPRPEALAEFQGTPSGTTWRAEEDPQFYWKEYLLGRLVPASVVSWPNRLRGMPESLAKRVQTWRLLPIGWNVVEAYASLLRHPGAPGLDLEEALEHILRSQPEWVVWCVHDPDERDEYRPMTPQEVARQLRENVLGSGAARNFIAWSSAAAS